MTSIVLLALDPSVAHSQTARSEAEAGAPPVVTTQGPDWSLRVEPDATISINHKGTPIIRAEHVFWQDSKWTWSPSKLAAQPKGSGQYVLNGECPSLKLRISGTVETVAENTVVVDYQFHAVHSIPDVLGGGLEWSFVLDSPSFSGRLPDPVLLEGPTGWAWPVAADQSITVRSNRPLAGGDFAGKQKNAIRMWFYKNQIPAGPRHIRLTIELPMGAIRELSIRERYGEPDTRRWYRDVLGWDAAPVDLRFLNRNDRPAGRHGFIRADGDRLIFADATPARFWGANLAGNALFQTPRVNIASQARRLAQLGYNLVRFAHHDSWSKPNVFIASSADTRHLNPAALDTLDWWIKCLKDEGIYVWLDMVHGRLIVPGDGVSTGIAEIMKRGGALVGFDYYNTELQALMKEFQHAYLNHVNGYTKLAYKDDPAVVGILVTNEDDLTQHYGNLMLPDKNNPVHNAFFTGSYQAFARQHALPEAKVFMTWEPGPSKLYLNDFEHRFNTMMLADLNEIGVKVPIATTSAWGGCSLLSLPALTDGGVIDVHSYGNGDALSVNPRHESNFVGWIGKAQVHDKPLTVSEWNFEAPAPLDRFTGPLYVAGIAALQGWDAPMIFTYAQLGLTQSQGPERWSTCWDPAVSGIMPAAALAFRQGHISPARSTSCLMLDADVFFNRELNPNTSATIRTLVEQTRLTIGMPAVKELPWLKPTQPGNATVVTDPDRDFIPEGQFFVRSDTGELTRDWQLGVQTIDSPRTQAVSGWIGGTTFHTKDASFRFTTRKAVVALTSVDDQPLSRSGFILITAIARAVTSPGDRLPVLTEPVVGTITLRTSVADLELLSLGRDGRVGNREMPMRSAGNLIVPIPAKNGTHWFVLKAVDHSREAQPAKKENKR
jgi:hypothetical protein